uniref:Uncharacterized protein n=1 Tax=Anguilla anguilla TaxID=7936 RepID=A0A0E9UGR0_ANGAN
MLTNKKIKKGCLFKRSHSQVHA